MILERGTALADTGVRPLPPIVVEGGGAEAGVEVEAVRGTPGTGKKRSVVERDQEGKVATPTPSVEYCFLVVEFYSSFICAISCGVVANDYSHQIFIFSMCFVQLFHKAKGPSKCDRTVE